LGKAGSRRLPVDYWEHLGLGDRFAKRNSFFLEDNKRYAAAWRRSVYTPEFLLLRKDGAHVLAAMPMRQSQSLRVVLVVCQ